MFEKATDQRQRRLAWMLFVPLLFATSISHAESGWQNPADRYADAWKQYRDAGCPVPADGIEHFVYFAGDREALADHPLLDHSRFSGAQIMYRWRQLEPSKDAFDFSPIAEDLAYLQAHGKRLWVQLQDATFYPQFQAVPDYLLSEEYDGGAVEQRNDEGVAEGWVARRWNENVRRRFAALLQALGREFDGRIEGINLQESAVGVSREFDGSFTPEIYVEALKANMLAMKEAFPGSVTMQYANFMPGEWLPWEDKGYLRAIYAFANKNGIGLGAPDLMFRRRGALNHSLAMMHESDFAVPLGIAVQDGNYIGETNSDDVVEERENIVPLLHAFAADFLEVDYMFWVDQAPYFEEDVLSCFNETGTDSR